MDKDKASKVKTSHLRVSFPTCRRLKASGKIEDRASQALVWRVGWGELCRVPGKGPVNIIVQKVTTCRRSSQVGLLNSPIKPKFMLKMIIIP